MENDEVEIDITDQLSDAEIKSLFSAFEAEDWTDVDRMIDTFDTSGEWMDVKKGGADRNRGGAEKLRKYWTVGEGAAKIRWHTGGDFTRCVEHLSKYLGPRSKGYCANLHHTMNGYWPGSKLNKTTLDSAEYNSVNDISIKGDSVGTDIDIPHIEYKDVGVKGFTVTDSSEGIVTTIVSVTGVKDRVNDNILPGAYEKTLMQRTPKGIWSHDWNQPISKTLDVKELMPGDPALPKKMPNGDQWPAYAGALKLTTQFNMKTARGRDAFNDVVFYGDDQEWCADEDTEILTERGWLHYSQLTTDDRAYVLDTDTQTAKFEQVTAVNTWPEQTRRMRLIETGGFSSLTTAAHRWPVRFQEGHTGWRTTETLVASNSIFRSAPRSDAPSENKWSDAFVELVAWYWTEGWKERETNICIAQSDIKNARHVTSLRNSMNKAFPGNFSENKTDDGMVRFRLFKEAAEQVHSVTGLHKAPTPEFILSLTDAQLQLFVQRCMDGDGHITQAGQKTWYQVSNYSVRMFEMVCALAGIPAVSRQPKDYDNRFGATPKTVSLLKSKVAKPIASIKAKTFNNKPRKTVATDEWIDHTGVVWCPTTPSGTWLARRNGSVYFTGNSIGYHVPLGGSTMDTKTGVRNIHTLDLFEYSPVLFGAMPMARTTSVKDAQTAYRAAMGAKADIPEDAEVVADQVTPDASAGFDSEQLGYLETAVSALKSLVECTAYSGVESKAANMKNWSEEESPEEDENEDGEQGQVLETAYDSVTDTVDNLLGGVGMKAGTLSKLSRLANAFDDQMDQDDPTKMRNVTKDILGIVQENLGSSDGMDMLLRKFAGELSTFLNIKMEQDANEADMFDLDGNEDEDGGSASDYEMDSEDDDSEEAPEDDENPVEEKSVVLSSDEVKSMQLFLDDLVAQ